MWRRDKLARRRANHFRLSECVSSPEIKYISLFQKCKPGYIHRHPVPTRGALAIVTNVGRGCGGRESCDRRARLKRTAKTCGPDVAVLASMHPWAIAFGALGRQKSRSPGRARYKP